ncbi:leucine-rich repeats and immunoglobulin-like domains protein 1 [Dermacentor albipictus]|uniref:leucine-rich repeats and immunoglobulin-like domains protein 1 n=1 Tax=Dermacentor albipictus TaxID=60249 RepID=UPI0038FCE92F
MLVTILLATTTLASTIAAGSDPPRLHPFAFPKDHPLGQAIAVTCIASQGAQPLHFEWLKDGRPLPVGGRKAISKMVTASVSLLTVLDVGAEDVGNYTCTATNAAGSDRFTAELVVADQPRIQPFAFPPNVNAGEEVSVTCVAALGRKPLRFDWQHDGRVLASNARKHSRVVVDNIVTLTIERVTAEDVGNYTCTVTNGFGSDSATAALIVEAGNRRANALDEAYKCNIGHLHEGSR